MSLVHVTGGLVLVVAPELDAQRLAEGRRTSPLSMSSGIAVTYPEGTTWEEIEEGVRQACTDALERMRHAMEVRAAAIEGRPVPLDAAAQVPAEVRDRLAELMPNRRSRRALENG